MLLVMLLLSCSCSSLALAVDVAITVSIDDAKDFHLPGPPTVQRGEFYRWKSNVCLLRKICGRAFTPAVCVAPLPLCQGQSFTDKKRETRSEYAKRLKKAAATLLKAFVDKAIGDMEERCRRLCKARGGHFEASGMARVLPDRACKCF